jgi:hypothetical protein
MEGDACAVAFLVQVNLMAFMPTERSVYLELTVRGSNLVGARFSAPVQTGPGAHPASCTMGTGSFPGVESGRGVTLIPHLLLVQSSKNRIVLYLYSPSWPSWPVERVNPTSIWIYNCLHRK